MRRAVVILTVLAAAGCSMLKRSHLRSGGGREEVFGYSVEGREIRGVILGEGQRCKLLFAVIHGDEPLGAPLLERLVEELQDRPELLSGRKVVVIPVVNPDGLRRNIRRNVRKVDLNRNFPARNFKPSTDHGPVGESEPETRALVKAIRQFNPSAILAVHAPLHCVNWDGPADDVARRMARSSGYPPKPSIGYPTPGSLGSYAGHDLRIPTVTLELPDGITAEKAWADLAEALEIFLRD